MPDGIATFPGIEQIVEAHYTRAHGIQPGAASLTIAPQAGIVGETGDLIFAFEGTSENGNSTYIFSGCKLDRMNFQRDTRGLIVRLAVLDRRWKWEFPSVSGTYNMRHENGELVSDLSQTQALQTANLILNTEMAPQDLATICLEAMGEVDYDVSALPNDARPLVEWDCDNAARALEDLCELLGCRVVLTMEDTVRICRVGVGDDLPDNLDVQIRSPGVDLPEKPDTIRIFGNRIRVQADLLLEPVGLDIDGQTKPIDQLSYIPKTNGVADYTNIIAPYFLGISDLKARELAKQSLWRWYRVKVPFTVNLFNNPTADSDPALLPVTVKSLMEIAPLEDMQVDQEVENGLKRFKQAWIWGIWGTDSLGYVNGVTTLKTLDPNFMAGELAVSQPVLGTDADFAKKSLYFGGFSIDKDRCIVKFSEIVAYMNSKQDANSNTNKPISAAFLYLRTALCIRDPKTRAWIRYNKRRDYGTDYGTEPKDIRHDDVILNVANRYDPTYSYDPSTAAVAPTGASIISVSHNRSDCDQACGYYLDAAEQHYLAITPEVRTYTGFQVVELDGAIQQVTFSLTAAGATTTIARNTEIIANRMQYNEKRFYDRMKRLREKSETSQQQQDRNARRRAPV